MSHIEEELLYLEDQIHIVEIEILEAINHPKPQAEHFDALVPLVAKRETLSIREKK